MSNPHAWARQLYLDELRPAPRETVKLALIASYSVDLAAVTALLLALIGRNSDTGSGSAVDFAQAVDTLRDRVRIIIQRGRIARAPALPRIAGILDQFIIEQPHDERDRSWHPKIALVAYEGPDKSQRWNLWIGSRNLTRSQDLDVGVMLEGLDKRGKGRVRLPGIGALGTKLAQAAARPDAAGLAATLEALWWQAPQGFQLRALFDALDTDSTLPLQPPEGRIDGLTLISPFLSPAFLKRALTWGPDGARILVSSMPALVEMANTTEDPDDPDNPLQGFSRILAYAPPELAPAEPAPSDNQTAPEENPAEDDEAEMPAFALHAKMVCFHRGDNTVLRVGSANATARAWQGRNAEVMLELEADTTFKSGLAFLIGKASPVLPRDLAAAPRAPAREADALEEARKTLLARWSPVLRHDKGRFHIDAGIAPVAEVAPYQLRAGAANGDLLDWPEAESRLDLGEIPLSHQSAFIQVQIKGETDALRWMQRVAVDPPLDDQRDKAALASHMGLRTFHDWMRSMLAGDAIALGGPDWDDDGSGSGKGHRDKFYDRLTLEDILGAWARDRDAFNRADRHFGPYVTALLAHDTSLSAGEKADLGELARIWAIAQKALTR